jgi:hypothetical protein
MMKHSFKIVVGAITLAFATNIKAQTVTSFTELDRDNFYVRMSTYTNSEKLKVFVENYGESPVLFLLLDEKGMPIYKRKLSKDKLKDNFILNLEQVADGNYTVEVSDKLSFAKKAFKKETQIVIAKPIFAKPLESLVALD